MDSTMPSCSSVLDARRRFGLCQWIPSFFGDSPSFCFSALTDSQRFPQSIRSFSYVCHSRFLFLDGIDISFFITVRSITTTNGFLIYGGSGPKGFG